MGTTDRRTARFSTPAPITHSHTGTTRARRPTIPSMAAVESTTAPARASSTAAEGGHSSTHNTHKPAQFTQLAAPTGAGGDGPGPSTVGCLPKAARFLSPRTYFAALTPRTKASLGDDDYTEQLRALREKFPESADADMVPFIRVCKGDVKEAANMYGECLQWRASMLPVSRDSCLEVLQRGMFFFHGEDKDGRPLGYLTMRGHDPKTRNLDACLRAIVFQCEALIASKGGKEFQVTIVLDRNGTGKSNQDPDMMKLFFALFSERYPDKLRRVLVCPANFMFSTFWSVIKYSMPERVRNKVTMCASESQLLEYVAPEQLITSLGGKDGFDATKVEY